MSEETLNEATGGVIGNKPSALDLALDMIARFEGFSSRAYPDATGYSIGYGHFIRPGDPYTPTSFISESEARTLLKQDTQGAANCVRSSVQVALTSNQEAALISFVYNVGCGAFQGSTMLRKLNAGDYAGASREFPRWNKSNGKILTALTERRAEELEVFAA